MKEAWRYIWSKAEGTGHLHCHHWGKQLPCVGDLSKPLFFISSPTPGESTAQLRAQEDPRGRIQVPQL